MTRFKSSDISKFWEGKFSSFGRRDDHVYYKNKAREHVSFIQEDQRNAPCLDLACGAGELLFHLKDYLNVKVGLDYSSTMLEQASKILSESEVKLLKTDINDYLPNAEFTLWTTTGGLNQYLNEKEMHKFLNLFKNNNNVKSLYLFDCIDPIRYHTFMFGSSYVPEINNSRKRKLSNLYRAYLRWRVALQFASGVFSHDVVSLKTPGMGYAYSPEFWLNAAMRYNFDINIISSKQFEYRYHVVLHKMH